MNTDSATRTGGFGRPLLSLLAAAVSVLAIVVLARTAVGTASGQRVDQLVSSGAKEHQGRLSHYAEIAVGTVNAPVIGRCSRPPCCWFCCVAARDCCCRSGRWCSARTSPPR